ncbi:MAG: hypothetical protein RIR62_1759 [Pseudomonadota bacterium]
MSPPMSTLARAVAALSLSLPLGLTLAAPLRAAPAEPMTAEAFEAYATGRTLSYAQGAQVWGSEQYLPGRRVIWAFADGACQHGTWYPQGEEICFVYEGDPAPQCWTFWQQADGLRARFAGDPSGTELAEVAQSEKPLSCPGPDVGA